MERAEEESMSSAAERFVVGGEEEQLVQQHPMYHVAQHSRREELRFPPEDSPPSSSLPPLHDPPTAWPLYAANTLTSFFAASSSSSSSSSTYYSQNPKHSIAFSTQFSGHNSTVSLPTHHQHHRHHHQISSTQGFYLSLCSSPSSPPPPPFDQFDVGPLGPFTGYATVLNRSSFLEPAQQLLEEICGAGRTAVTAAGESSASDLLLDADPPEPSPMDHRMNVDEDGRISGTEQQWKKTRLISMLDEVYRRYRRYCQQVQAVITSFESVVGLSTAAPYAFMGFKAMSKHFRRLRNMISDHLHYTNLVLGKEGLSSKGAPSFGLINNGACLPMVNNSGTFGQLHIWRPQRGLPECAVAVLRAWLFEHFLHPYPTDTDKQMLAKQTGLTRNQVSNWFINARVRLWKPMVEEIHSLEKRQLYKVSADDKSGDTDELSHLPSASTSAPDEQSHLPSSSTSAPSNSQPAQSANTQKNQHPTTKRIRDDLTQIPNHDQEPFNFVYDVLPGHQHIGVGMDVSAGGNSGISLTLGLHQANGICLAEPLPSSVVRCFGLGDCSDAYAMGTFNGQD